MLQICVHLFENFYLRLADIKFEKFSQFLVTDKGQMIQQVYLQL